MRESISDYLARIGRAGGRKGGLSKSPALMAARKKSLRPRKAGYDIDAMLTRYDAGEPLASIAADCGVSASAISHMARRRGRLPR